MVFSVYQGIVKIPLFDLPWTFPAISGASPFNLDRFSPVPFYTHTSAGAGSPFPGYAVNVMPSIVGASVTLLNPGGDTGLGGGDTFHFCNKFIGRQGATSAFCYQSRLPGTYLINLQKATLNGADQGAWNVAHYGAPDAGIAQLVPFAIPLGAPGYPGAALGTLHFTQTTINFAPGSGVLPFFVDPALASGGPTGLGLLNNPINLAGLNLGALGESLPVTNTQNDHTYFFFATQPFSFAWNPPFLSSFISTWWNEAPLDNQSSFVTLDNVALNEAWGGSSSADLGANSATKPYFKGWLCPIGGYVDPRLPGQKNTIILFSMDMSRHWLIELSPQTAKSIAAIAGAGAWSFAIDIDDIVYFSTGEGDGSMYTNYTASFGLPELLTLSLATFSLPCFNPCVEDWTVPNAP